MEFWKLFEDTRKATFLKSFLEAFGYDETSEARFTISFSPDETGNLTSGTSALFRGPLIRSREEIEYAKSLVEETGFDGVEITITE